MELTQAHKRADIAIMPEDWGLAALEDLSAFITKGATPTTFGFKWERSGILFLRSENITDRGIDLSGARMISEEANRMLSRSEIRREDILIAITGYVGRVAIFDLNVPANINQHVARVRIGSAKAKSQFLFYWLSQPSVRRNFENITTGQAYPQISLTQVRNAVVPLPPLQEQSAIAEALLDVDAKIGALARLIAKKRVLRQGVMQRLLSGQTRLPGFGPRTSEYKKTEIGPIPEDWDAVRLGELFEFKNGLNKAKRFFGSGTPIVNYMDVFGRPDLRSEKIAGKVDVSKSEREAYEVRQGDVFFTRTSETVEEVGIAAVMLDPVRDTVYSGFVLRARPKDESLDNLFKVYCFSPQYFRQQIISRASYTTRALTNGRSLSATFLARPPVAEQIAIARVLADFDREILALDARLNKTRAVKQAMMQALLTGRIRFHLAGEAAPEAKGIAYA